MSIVLQGLVKRFDGHPVVNRVSLEVDDGELFVLLGPSGSGKSTVLRMIAGLAEIDEGRVLLHGRDVTALPPQQRGVGLVFQHYALFRNMTVAQNIEFPLRIRSVRRTERRRRCDELLELVGLTGLGDRMPGQLSGGQQQRVALSRALAHKPEVLLLDEPFGALDAKIRAELRRTIRSIQRELGVTTIFVTHDQDEAFELGDRIAVMDFGRLLEVGPPRELYLRPQTEFVATFLGTANLMVGETAPDGVRLGPLRFPLGTETAPASESRRVQVLFRPEDVAVKDTREALTYPLIGRATVEESAFVGSFERLRLRMPPLPGVRTISPPAPFGGDFILVEASRSQAQARQYPLAAGDTAWVGVRRVHALSHPGLSLLILGGDSSSSDAAVDLGLRIAGMARARVTVLAAQEEGARLRGLLQEARRGPAAALTGVETRLVRGAVGTELVQETLGQSYDLIIGGLAGSEGVQAAEDLLRVVEAHLLLVGAASPIPRKVLISVALGEPGKEDILFTGRLVRHVGAEATILTVLPPGADDRAREQAGRFLDAGIRTLSLMGVPATPLVRHGSPIEEILKELQTGAHDLLAVGAPLGAKRSRSALGAIVGEICRRDVQVPILIVRSSEMGVPK
jgi:sulfate transport system ATP-binding protein